MYTSFQTHFSFRPLHKYKRGGGVTLFKKKNYLFYLFFLSLPHPYPQLLHSTSL